MKPAIRPFQQPQGVVERQPHVRPLTEREAAEHCRYFDRGCADPLRAFQQWARRAGVPVKRVGRARLYELRILDAFMEREQWTLRHARRSAKKAVTKLALVSHAADSAEVAR